jgi:hypothetical protein
MYCDRNEAIAEEQSGVGAPSHGVVTPKDCPAGFYCPNGTQTARQYPCPVGTYSNTTNLESEDECRLCPEGFYCEAENITEPTGLCTPGFYCVLGASHPSPSVVTSTGGPCHQGTWCERGWSWPSPCPVGTYGSSPNLGAEVKCTICPPGEFCSSPGLPAPNGSCLAGFFCNNGSQEENPVNQVYGNECPVGAFCPEHSYEPTLCPSGTFQPYTRMTNESACEPCLPGYYCSTPGQENVTGECYAGFYCLLGASSPAPNDTITGAICPIGSYCPQGSHINLHCANGTYTNHTGASECYECPEGYYCVDRDRAVPCPTGYYCPLNTGADLQPCPPGTYNPIEGIRNVSECTQCDGGMYCLTKGLSAPSGNCTEGYYCSSGKN